MAGAPGATAFTMKDCDTCGAALNAAPPAWLASIMQVPAATNVTVPPVVTVHTLGEPDEKLTGNPDDAVAVNVGAVPKSCAPGLLKAMVCGAFGVTALDSPDDAPVPIRLAALTEKR